MKKVFLKLSQNSQRNTCVRFYILIITLFPLKPSENRRKWWSGSFLFRCILFKKYFTIILNMKLTTKFMIINFIVYFHQLYLFVSSATGTCIWKTRELFKNWAFIEATVQNCLKVFFSYSYQKHTSRELAFAKLHRLMGINLEFHLLHHACFPRFFLTFSG